MLVVAGLEPTLSQPEVDPLNFLTRVTVPIRMVNLSADYFYPLEASVKPFFKLLEGAPKDMIVMEGAGHFTPRKRIYSETLHWFDRFPAPKL